VALTHNIQDVATKGYSECSREELKIAYKDAFGMIPCPTCKGIDWAGVHLSITKYYNKFTNIKIPKEMESEKFMWNPAYKGMTAFYKGIAVKVGEPIEQNILEAFYNDPNRNGLVLAIEQLKTVTESEVISIGTPVFELPLDKEELADLKTQAKQMFESGMSISQVAKALSISYPTAKKYIKA
jgi:hypothetical protein